MMTRKQIIDHFVLSPADMQYVDRLRAVQIAGARHGKAGYYPDGEFGSDADWCNGIGAEIQELETALGDVIGAVFDMYSDAHSAHYRDGTINPGERSWCPDIYDMWFGACAPTEVSVHAESFEDALELAAAYCREQGWDGLFVSDEEMSEALAEACAERGFTPADIDWSDLRGEHAAAVEAAEADTTYTEAGRIPSDEWGGSGPR